MTQGLVLIASWISLLWERLWNRLWAPVSVTFLFAGLAIMNAPLIWGPAWHLAFLTAFAVVFTVAFLRTPAGFRFPRRADVDRRIEDANGLRHRPLETLKDAPVTNDSEAFFLWQKHRQQAAETLRKARSYRPHTDVARQDRWHFRYAAFVFLVLALATVRGEAPARLKDAFHLDTSAFAVQNAVGLDLWIVPPEYTHEAALFLSTARQGIMPHEDPVRVPAGSLLKLRLAGLKLPPHVSYADESLSLTRANAENFTLDLLLQKSGDFSLRNFFFGRIGMWRIEAAADQAPTVSINTIEPGARSATKITFTAHDDYGISKMTGTVAAGKDTYLFDISPPADVTGTHVEDLTALPTAGEEATLTLEAQDAAGHKTASAPVTFMLPERYFSNPVAQRIANQRKILLHRHEVAVERVVAQDLAHIAQQPGLYKGDINIYLSLGTAVKRLMYDGSDGAVASVTGLLWDIALKLEDGGFSQAQQSLSDALQKLQQALNDKSLSKAELQGMMDEVQRKMREYVQSLAQELQQRMQQGRKMPALSPELAQQFMKSLDINKLIAQMQQMSQTTSREDLQKMAENLQNTIDNLDMKKMDGMQEKQMKAMQSLQNLEDIIHQQQALYDKTNKTDDPADLKDQKQEQAAIRAKLNDSLRDLGAAVQIPENFPKADQAMKQSGDALGRGEAQTSLPQQKEALDQLQKGLNDTIKKMAEQMQQSLLSYGMPGESGFGNGFDPLGRHTAGDDGTVKIPAEKERRRVQQIIEELRRRSNEPNRTKVERDYIDRLLEQF